MQSPAWYYRRLRSMTPGEIAWRARSTLRDVSDRLRVASGSYGPGIRPAGRAGTTAGPTFLVQIEPGAWNGAAPDAVEAEWRRALVARADRISGHRLSMFHLPDVDLGHPIDWNRDHESNRPAPLAFSASIDYRVHAITGDAKIVWEPNRHHQFVVLGRAYRATGNPRYAAAVVDQLTSWLDQCPPGRGMNWRSPLELAIRAINWVWALDLIRPSGLITPAFESRFLDALDVHVWDIARKYSRGSSANNHRIGEAAGVFMATSCCPSLSHAARLREHSHGILSTEILEQTYADGATREQAFGYHLFVAQFFLFAGIVARRTGRDFPAPYWQRLERMIDFAAAMTEAGPLPAVGDGDDGYVLDFDDHPPDARGLFACGAILFRRADLAHAAGGQREIARWLFGEDETRLFERVRQEPLDTELRPRAFEHAGYYLLQRGSRGAGDSVSVLFDCGELGFGSIAAHGHADALSFTLRAGGVDLLVDPGTYDYFTYPAWREYFRTTSAHNTIAVDDLDQSVRVGPFMWGARARSRLVDWHPDRDRPRVSAEHDGYARLADPVIHRRTIELEAAGRGVTVIDELSMREPHRIAIYFHCAPHCALVERGGGRFVLATGHRRMTVTLDPCLEPAAARGEDTPGGGWVSAGYHRREPAWVLSGTARVTAPTRLVTRITCCP